jgi:two-component system phosphate regulon sensor histidine kinase PhoR
MNYFLVTLIVILLFALAWFAWHYIDLRRRLDEYARTLRQMQSLDLPTDVKQLEYLSNTINSLAQNFNQQFSTITAERNRLATLLDQMTDGVLIADADGNIQFANPAAKKLFETSHAVGRTVTEVVRHHQLVEAWRRCQQNGGLQSETVELPARRQFLQMIVIPDQHAGGSLLLVQDLTRVRRLETVRRDFISNISHELRTPLASLKALTETLQGGALSDPEAGPRFMGRIITEVDALTQMAQELLDLSKIESGQVALNLAPVSPKQLLMSAADRMKLQAERAGVNLRVECENDLPNIQADKARLEQVLVNLIHNAVKFTKPGGDVILSADSGLFGEAARAGVRFAVKDSGIGIPSDHISRVFERFYRVDKSRTGSGTGLGLSISKHIVEAHGGKIWAESEEGRGSIFYFNIPAQA